MIKSSLNKRKAGLIKLGEIFDLVSNDKNWPGFSIGINEEEYNNFNNLLDSVHHHNGWFSVSMVKYMLNGWSKLLKQEKLDLWLSNYTINNIDSSKTIAIICAGNIPMVGFHDFLCVYLIGNPLKLKLSSDDNVLIPAVIDLLSKFDIDIHDQIDLVKEKLSDFDAVIATGSNNTSRYFYEYFGKYPHIIRKSRTSIAVLNGNESEEDLERLSDDVFLFYGLGCRNVTKLFLPKGFDINRVFKGFYSKKEVISNNKYANNYDYYKAIFLLEKYELIENGFIILKEDSSLFSPIGTLYYEFYDDLNKLEELIKESSEDIQCRVGHNGLPFGKAQQPELWDYADNIDTIEFLINLK